MKLETGKLVLCGLSLTVYAHRYLCVLGLFHSPFPLKVTHVPPSEYPLCLCSSCRPREILNSREHV
jgi:hypothetical protein